MKTETQTRSKTAIIGGGLGGLSTAVALASQGFDVEIFEKNSHLGGKLNVLQQDGFTFDLGPSILTLPHIFRHTFEQADRKMEDYVSLEPVRPHWRNFFSDGTVIDLDPDPDVMKTEMAKLNDNPYEQVCDFLEYSKRQYNVIAEGYFEHGLDNIPQFLKFYGPKIFKLSIFSTMDKAIRRRIGDPYLQDILNFFIKYVGSSATRAPGFMTLLPHIQFGYGLYYVKGGMHALADGLEKLLRELGVKINLEAEVTGISTAENTVNGVIVDGEYHRADWVVSNMEVIPAYKKLLHEDEGFMKKFDKFEPACSGLVLHLGVDRVYEQLAHHNFFYSDNQKEHFRSVFEKKELPEDPTIYVVAPSRSNPNVAPEGYDNIKILPHIPYINDKKTYTEKDYSALKNRVLEKLENTGLSDLRKHIVTEHVWTPYDIQENYYSNGGSIYGVVTDIWKNYAFKAPRQSTKYRNLFFVGGSANPGGGMPMVTLSGQLAAKEIILKS
ncbi:MAG: phytoene desaturase family protein [Verrucomicrobiota bacterium]